MKGIMFNEHYGLESATLDGSKTRTSRNEFNSKNINTRIFIDLLSDDNYMSHSDTLSFDEIISLDTFIIDDSYNHYEFKTKYAIGEIVAIKQAYKDAGVDFIPYNGKGKWGNPKGMVGWTNKMFVRADLMPHQIQITDIKLERLQDISDEDCLKEGIKVKRMLDVLKGYSYSFVDPFYFYTSPRKAFASLIDKISGKGTWKRNEYQVVYYYKLIK